MVKLGYINGYKGKSCLNVVSAIESLVGKVENLQYTSEYYEPDEVVRFFLQQGAVIAVNKILKMAYKIPESPYYPPRANRFSRISCFLNKSFLFVELLNIPMSIKSILFKVRYRVYLLKR
jgi:hypothetical protein